MRKHLLLAFAVMLAACSDAAPSEPPRNSIQINVAANASAMPWLDKVLSSANGTFKTKGGRAVWVNLQAIEAGDAVSKFKTPANVPVMWMPDSAVWADVAKVAGVTAFGGDCADTAQSPLVIGMHKPVADLFGYPARTLGWLDLSSLAGDPGSWRYYTGGQYGTSLRMGHTHPGVSGSGASTLLAVVQAARSTTAPVPAAELKQPIIQASVGSFEGGVALFGKNSVDLAATMSERGAGYLGAIVAYESDIAGLAKDSEVVPIYPFEGTFVATHPACVNAGAGADAREAAIAFRDYLLGEKGQALAVESGLRPMVANPKLKLADVLSKERGFDLNQPKVQMASPPAANVLAVQELWQAARKPINLVMVLDISGSMAGDKLVSMRRAAADFVNQMSKDDQLTVIAFSSNINTVVATGKVDANRASAARTIGALNATGGTLLYDAIGAGADMIKKTNSPSRSNVLIVLTDGLDSGSRTWRFDARLSEAARANNTSVYTIAFGSDADTAKLGQLAKEGNGTFYKSTEANISQVYSEMSTAFGGSAGIGR